MRTKGIHFMALDDVQRRLGETDAEYKDAIQQLDEAVKMGDLRENAEYDTAKATVNRIAQLRDELTPALAMPVVKSNDNIRVIEEGSIIELTVWSVTQTPVEPTSLSFAQLKQVEPSFHGRLMFGGTLHFHELIADKALSVDTQIGRYILGKQGGDYSVAVAGGFANITVEKLNSATPQSEIQCELNGVKL